MGLGLFGPVELVVDGRARDLGGPRQRIVLGVLGLNVNRVVPVERLVDAVWGQSPPPTARGQVQICISALRKLFADAGKPGVIATRSPGYLLRMGTDEVDSLRFAALVADARQQADAGEPDAAASTLRAALALWRGAALADLPGDLVRRSALVLEEQRLAALEERIRLDLVLGRHQEVIGELQALVAEHPLRERLPAYLMRALHATGRQAEALDVGRRARARIVEEIGLEPGPELRETERAILCRDAGPPAVPGPRPAGRRAGPVPRQLPACAADFTGRAEHLAEIPRLLDAGDPGTPIVAVSGRAGVGKSALAVRAAHQLVARYPDGQLYADLGAGGGAGTLSARFLRALGVPGPAVPDDVEERVQLYRSELSGRRVLLVLDGVTDESQVLPLLPGGPTCAVVVTSRARLGGLPGAHRLDVDVFDHLRSRELLARIIGAERVAAEPAAAAELVERCGGLPLALRILGSRLAARPHRRLAGLVGRLREAGGSLDEFAHHGVALRSAFDSTHRVLDERSRRLFRLSALVRAPDFAGWTAAALLGTTAADAEEVLDGLVDARLVDVDRCGDDPPRYRLHELVRHYAAEKLRDDGTEQERAAALDRVLAETGHRRDHVVVPGPRRPGRHARQGELRAVVAAAR